MEGTKGLHMAENPSSQPCYAALHALPVALRLMTATLVQGLQGRVGYFPTGPLGFPGPSRVRTPRLPAGRRRPLLGCSQDHVAHRVLDLGIHAELIGERAG